MSAFHDFLKSIKGAELVCDVDGVLADTKGAALRSVAPHVHPDQIITYEIMAYLTPEERAKLHACWADPNWWAEVLTIPGAVEAFSRIRESAKHVIFATRAWVGCTGWETARRHWLAVNFGVEHDDVAVIGPKERIDGDVILEDMPENLSRFVQRRVSRRGWLYSHAYNRSFEWPWRLTWPIKEKKT